MQIDKWTTKHRALVNRKTETVTQGFNTDRKLFFFHGYYICERQNHKDTTS